MNNPMMNMNMLQPNNFKMNQFSNNIGLHQGMNPNFMPNFNQTSNDKSKFIDFKSQNNNLSQNYNPNNNLNLNNLNYQQNYQQTNEISESKFLKDLNEKESKQQQNTENYSTSRKILKD